MNIAYLPNPLRMPFQECLESVKLLLDTLDVVETIDTDDNLAVLKLSLQSLDAVYDGFLLEALCELFRINTDWEHADLHITAIVR